MDSLVQRLKDKDLDQIKFQQLCFELMSEIYPAAKIRYVEGVAGDEGLDLFAGNLSAGPAVWHCIAFQVTIIGDSQKSQIRKSLRDAVKNVSPRMWVLCVNMNFDTKAHRWFQRLQQSYAARGVAVADPMQGIDIARELWSRRTLRNRYFPGVALDVAEIRALMTGTDTLDDTAREKLTTENAQQWLDRLREKDPRFTDEVTIGAERGPGAFPPPPQPGLNVAMTDGNKFIKAFASDGEALRLDPVGFQLQVSGKGAQKVVDLSRTGKKQHWEPEEIQGFASTVPLLSGINFQAGKTSLTMGSVPDNKIIPLRLTFRNATSTVILDYVEFKKVRGGTHEVELSTCGDEPLRLTLVLPVDGSSPGTVGISRHFVGKGVKAVARATGALQLLQDGCDIEIFVLKLDAKLGVLRVDPVDVGLKSGFFSFVDDLSKIVDRLGTDLTLPDPQEFTEDDEKAFRLLRALVFNGTMQLDDMTLTLVKSQENAELVPEQIKKAVAFRTEHDNYSVTLFGRKVYVGPCATQLDRAEVKELEQTIARFRRANIGDGVKISLRPLTPVRFGLLPPK